MKLLNILDCKDIINSFVAIGTILLAYFSYKQIKFTKELSEKESIRINNEINRERKSMVQKILMDLKNQKRSVESFMRDFEEIYSEEIDEFGFNDSAFCIASQTVDAYHMYGRWEIDPKSIGSLYDVVDGKTDFIEKINKNNSDFIEFEQDQMEIREFYNSWKENPSNSPYVRLINKKAHLIIEKARSYLDEVETSISKLTIFIKS